MNKIFIPFHLGEFALAQSKQNMRDLALSVLDGARAVDSCTAVRIATDLGDAVVADLRASSEAWSENYSTASCEVAWVLTNAYDVIESASSPLSCTDFFHLRQCLISLYRHVLYASIDIKEPAV